MITTALTLIGLFALRVGIPITVTLAAGEWIRRRERRGSEA